MRTPSIARQFLQQTLDAVRAVERNDEAPLQEWLTIHSHHMVCLELATQRGLISHDEADEWRLCANQAEPGFVRPSPLELRMVAHCAA